MQLKYLRIHLFYALLNPLQKRWRSRRMAALRSEMGLRDGMTVLDMGGQPMIWDSIQERLKITILNLPGIAMDTYPSHHDIQYVEGDACNCPEFKDKSFDSLSSATAVIEHVGDSVNRQRFCLKKSFESRKRVLDTDTVLPVPRGGSHGKCLFGGCILKNCGTFLLSDGAGNCLHGLKWWRAPHTLPRANCRSFFRNPQELPKRCFWCLKVIRFSKVRRCLSGM